MDVFAENYLLAFCEGGREQEILMLLETIDIKKVLSMKMNLLANIFKAVGRLSLESFAKKLIMEVKSHGNFMIFISMQNLEH